MSLSNISATSAIQLPECSLPGLPASSSESRWYAVYTCANREKRVVEQFAIHGINHFLPLYESTRRWKDRSVRLQLPLFPGYVFAQLALKNRLSLLQVPGVVNLVGFGGRPTPVPDEQLTQIQNLLTQGLRIEPHPYLRVGKRVQVINGPLQGAIGTISRRKNRARFVVTVEAIQRSVAIEMSEADLRPL